MRPMDTWFHHDRPMKMERTTLNDTSSSRATWYNLDALSWIEQTRIKDVNSWIVVLSHPLIKLNQPIQRLCPNFPIKSKCSSMERLFLDFFSKSNYLDITIWEPFDFYFF